MVSSFPRILIFLMMASLHVFAEDMQKNREREAARAVIMRTVPSLAASPEKLHLETIEKEDGYDVFETKASGGVLTIRGSSGTALCRGFYDFLKTNRLGMVSWENKDIRWPAQLPDTAPRRIVSPFRNHYYFNVVTYGYTMPYWTWERWEKEIDWMALHGINMPLALVATEGIAVRVWKQLGLTEKELLAEKIEVPRYRMLYLDQELNENGGMRVIRDEGFQKAMERLREVGDFGYILRKSPGYDDAASIDSLPAFTYMDPNDRDLVRVRRYFNLDSIAGAGDEISKIKNLLAWVHNTIRHDGSSYNPEEKNAIALYEICKKEDRGVNCRMMAQMLNECYLAMGFKSRYVTCLPKSYINAVSYTHLRAHET